MRFRCLAALLVFFLSAAPGARAEFIEKTITLDFNADSPDQVGWQGLDFATGKITADAKLLAQGWDVRLKLGYVSTNAGMAARAAEAGFDAVDSALTVSANYLSDERFDPPGAAPVDFYNRRLLEWFQYVEIQSGQDYLLFAKPIVFIVQTDDGHFAKVQFLDFIKNGIALRPSTDPNRFRLERVLPSDGKIHLKLRYRYNTLAGDTSL